MLLRFIERMRAAAFAVIFLALIPTEASSQVAPACECTSSAQLQYDLAIAAYGREEWDKAYPNMLAAAEQGHADAQFKLGEMYLGGRSVPRILEDAATWFLRAAEQGHADAQRAIGTQQIIGAGIEKDTESAEAWLLKAAQQGQVDAQLILAAQYLHGQQLPNDHEKGIYWTQRAADQGNVNAIVDLARMFDPLEGESSYGLPHDPHKATELFLRAAHLTSRPFVFSSLSSRYEKGEGAPIDLVEAYKWRVISMGAGSFDINPVRTERLETQMSAEQIEEAKRRAAAWHSTGDK